MMMAQRLYEAGYITYMRTDSTNLSADAISMVRGFIEGEFGDKYLPEKPNLYSSKEGAQEAHEAIRPSDVNLRPNQLSGMERDAERLYELIWRQFVACQMPPAQYLSTSVTVEAGDFELRAKGRILKFDGYTKVMPQQSKAGEDDVLPVNFLTATGDLDSCTLAPFVGARANMIREILVGQLNETGAEGNSAMFFGRAVAFLGTIAPILEWLSTERGVPTTLERVRDLTELANVVRIATKRQVKLTDSKSGHSQVLDLADLPNEYVQALRD